MVANENLFGIFFKVGFDPKRSPEELSNSALAFRPYVGGESGLNHVLQTLSHAQYGIDIAFVLLQFHVQPSSSELIRIKPLESYRKNEKSIAIPIIVDEDNFFSKNETERYRFLKDSILQKLDLLAEVVKKKKLDTNMELLKSDVENVLSQFGT